MVPLTFVSAVLFFLAIAMAVYWILLCLDRLTANAVGTQSGENRFLSILTPVFAILVPLNAKLGLRIYRASLALKFRMAGTDIWTADMFLSVKELSAMIGLFLGLVMFRSLSGGGRVVLTAGCVILFWFVPNILLRMKIQDRRKNITRELPYILDLLTVSVEAGLDFMQAIERVVMVMKTGDLVRELGIMHKGLQVGDSRSTALRQLASRTEVTDVKTVVSALIQADRLGTGIGTALRAVSTQARNQRSQRAEKMAGEATVKLLFPLILVFIAVMLMVLGPVVLQIVETLKSR